MFRTSKKVEPNRTELQTVEPKPHRTSNRTRDFRPNRTIVSNRTELRRFSLILTTCNIWYYCIHNNDIYRPLSSGFNLPNFKINYILDSPKLVVITELQVYCNYRIFGKKIKLLIKLIENRRKKQRKTLSKPDKI